MEKLLIIENERQNNLFFDSFFFFLLKKNKDAKKQFFIPLMCFYKNKLNIRTQPIVQLKTFLKSLNNLFDNNQAINKKMILKFFLNTNLIFFKSKKEFRIDTILQGLFDPKIPTTRLDNFDSIFWIKTRMFITSYKIIIITCL